ARCWTSWANGSRAVEAGAGASRHTRARSALCAADKRRQSRYPLDRHSPPHATNSHAARRVSPPSTAVANEKSVSVETTKPETTVDSFTEKVRPQPARR